MDSPEPFRVTPEIMSQYKALSDDLRFYADQRFKIMGAFILLNGFMANVAKDISSVWLGVLGVVFSYLFLGWERRTTAWWGRLVEALKVIELAGINRGVLVAGYAAYALLPGPRFTLKPSIGAQVVYLVFLLTWVAYGVHAWPHVWRPGDAAAVAEQRREVPAGLSRGDSAPLGLGVDTTK